MKKLTILEERFLTSYFEFEVLVGGFISDEEEMTIFNELSKIYLIPAERQPELRALTQLGEVKSIVSETDYNLHKRVESFKRLSGIRSSRDESYIANVKGRAISHLKDVGYNPALDVTKPSTFSFLTNTSQYGIITSMRVLGTLQILGIFTAKDKMAGIKLLKRCAKWNDADSILTLLAYVPEQREESISMLYSVSDGTPFEALFETARDFYGFTNVPRNRETDLIERAIGVEIIKGQIYSPQVARIVYSQILGYVDKKKLILNNKNLIGEANDLPINLRDVKLELSDKPSKAILKRDDERTEIIKGIMYASEKNSLAPCIVANDDFVSADYVATIESAFTNANVVLVDASTLNANDFSLDKNHVLVRSLAEDKKNIVIIVLKGRVDLAIVELLARFLRDTSREDFRLSLPSISLNLSCVLPVCICDTSSLKYIRHLCDCMDARDLSHDEALEAIDTIIERKTKEYGIDTITIEDDVKEAIIKRLGSFGEGAVVLDKMIYSCKGRGSSSTITLEIAEKFLDARVRKLGF